MERKEKEIYYQKQTKALWIGYTLIMILLIISLYYNIQLGSNAQDICDNKYKPLVEYYNNHQGNIQDITFNETNIGGEIQWNK